MKVEIQGIPGATKLVLLALYFTCTKFISSAESPCLLAVRKGWQGRRGSVRKGEGKGGRGQRKEGSGQDVRVAHHLTPSYIGMRIVPRGHMPPTVSRANAMFERKWHRSYGATRKLTASQHRLSAAHHIQ